MNNPPLEEKLTHDQLDFLRHHRIDLSDVLDATGMRPVHFTALMRDEKYKVAIGVSRCYMGHAMRRSSNHCVQCDPSGLGYQGRYHNCKYIYLFASEKAGLVKIGISDNVSQRLKYTNRSHMAGASDWRLCFEMNVGKAGPIEKLAHNKLKAHRCEHVYTHGYAMHKSREHFTCTPEDALQVLQELTQV